MTTAVRRRLASVRSGGDSGLSMMELIVSMGLSALVLSLVLSFFVQITTATVTANDSRQTTATGSNIATELSDVIRPATTVVDGTSLTPSPAIIEGTANSLTIYSNTDAVATDIRPTKISFTLNAKKQLVESRWAMQMDSTGKWVQVGTAATSTRVFPGVLIAASTASTASASDKAQLFEYVGSDCLAIDVGSDGKLPAAELKDVSAVRFTIRTRTETSPTATPITIQNVVGMPNVAQQCKDDS